MSVDCVRLVPRETHVRPGGGAAPQGGCAGETSIRSISAAARGYRVRGERLHALVAWLPRQREGSSPPNPIRRGRLCPLSGNPLWQQDPYPCVQERAQRPRRGEPASAGALHEPVRALGPHGLAQRATPFHTYPRYAHSNAAGTLRVRAATRSDRVRRDRVWLGRRLGIRGRQRVGARDGRSR
jgi:hypothetical protein